MGADLNQAGVKLVARAAVSSSLISRQRDFWSPRGNLILGRAFERSEGKEESGGNLPWAREGGTGTLRTEGGGPGGGGTDSKERGVEGGKERGVEGGKGGKGGKSRAL